jgi:hypothetical protein
MHATVRRNEGVVGKWTDGLSRETGQAVVRDQLEFEGFRSHDRWMRQPGSWSPGRGTTNPPKVTDGKVIAHEHVVPSPGPSARTPRRANALPREFHRRGSIHSTRRGLAARVGKR